jgi:hypothetical protein
MVMGFWMFEAVAGGTEYAHMRIFRASPATAISREKLEDFFAKEEKPAICHPVDCGGAVDGTRFCARLPHFMSNFSPSYRTFPPCRKWTARTF